MSAVVLITALSFGRYSPEPRSLLGESGYTVRMNELGRPMTASELQEAVSDADALIVGVDPVTAEVLDAAPRLKVVAKHGVGVDNIDLTAARDRGVWVANAPGSNTQAVADHAFGLLLAAARRIPEAHASVAAGRWDRFVGPEMPGKMLLVVGFGRIGRAVARRAGGFDIRVLVHDPYVEAEKITVADASPVSLEEGLGRADFVSLHIPALPEQGCLLDSEQLRAMKPGACLVNTARGGLVDEEALAEALRDGHLAAAGIDVFASEPPEESPLKSAPRVVLTPHVGAYSYEANRKMGVMAAESVRRVLSGKEPAHAVSV